MGMAISRPRGPHSQVQKMVEPITAMGVTPVPRPNTCGSTTWPMVISPATNRPMTMSTVVQPGSMAAAMSAGKAAAIYEPTYGTKRMSMARMPQATGLGMPMAHSARPMNTP